MRSLFLSLCAVVLCAPLVAQDKLEVLAPSGGKPVANTVAYAIGFELGSNLASNGVLPTDVTKEDLLRGIFDALESKELAVPQEQCQTAMKAFGEQMQARFAEKVKVKMAEGQKFLEENKKKEGVQTTQSGLQYKVIKAGNGASPAATDEVSVHYEGKLINGNVFDSSIARGKPVSFPVNGVIPGWTEALQKMKVGDKWQLFIPSELAYKDRGHPPVIGPHEVLVFEVELLEIKGK